ncbi:MAG: pirin family protein [Candidatus Schekmanbacteria bacterium]|nr:pirin family protein [Candidatus Schekmanbacteria bacterium]
MSIRPVHHTATARPAVEGAGVRLRRAFGFGETAGCDPFLLLDDFRSDLPQDYIAGFPWHPHRGIETITYVLAGSVEHGDSLGNSGAISPGGVQWMTAGSGIIHQEMPRGDGHGRMHGFQLWANLPAALKMTAPRYQDITAADIPEVVEDDGARIRVICGAAYGIRGPVDGVAADPCYLDVCLPPLCRKRLRVEIDRNAFAYVFSGSALFRDASEPRPVQTDYVLPQPVPGELMGNRTLVVFARGDEAFVQSGDEGARFLLVSGQPIREPVAWYGPIVMNTEQELRQAFAEYRNGTFLKHPLPAANPK